MQHMQEAERVGCHAEWRSSLRSWETTAWQRRGMDVDRRDDRSSCLAQAHISCQSCLFLRIVLFGHVSALRGYSDEPIMPATVNDLALEFGI